jgi:hypothetical protein
MVEFHHSIYNEHKSLHTKYKGIHSIYFVLYTKEPFKFPIDIFFKLIQSTKEYPYIKLNPGKKQENIYRLFAPKISENGHKVPLLKKKRIIKIINSCKKENTIYYIVDTLFKDTIIPVIVEINKLGHIYITIADLELLKFKDVETIVKNATQLILEKLIEYFDPSEQIFNKFESLIDDSVEIIDLKFKYVFKRQSKLNLSKYIKCFSSIFNLVEETDVIRMRYKRVSNFNELESMDSYLIDLINQQQTSEFIVNALSRDYNITMEEAAVKFNGVVSLYQASKEMARSTNRIFRIKNNPGFPIDIYKKERTIEVEISNINNVYYIQCLTIFINNFILFSQNILKDSDIEPYCDVKDVKIVDIEYEVEAPINFTDDLLNRVDPNRDIHEEGNEDFKLFQNEEVGNEYDFLDADLVGLEDE